jgi:hypothetical protein
MDYTERGGIVSIDEFRDPEVPERQIRFGASGKYILGETCVIQSRDGWVTDEAQRFGIRDRLSSGWFFRGANNGWFFRGANDGTSTTMAGGIHGIGA